MIAASVALAQFWPDWKRIAAVVAVFLIGSPSRQSSSRPNSWATRRIASGLADLRHVRLGYLFKFVGLLIAVPLAARSRCCCASGCANTYEPATRGKALMPTAPRQLARSNTRELRRGFLERTVECGRARLVDSWPAWPHRAVMLTGPAGRVNHRRCLARGGHGCGGCALDEAAVPAALPPARWSWRTRRRGVRQRALFHLLLARGAGIRALTARAAADFAIRDLGSPRRCP
jgi:hypothetical protein